LGFNRYCQNREKSKPLRQSVLLNERKQETSNQNRFFFSKRFSKLPHSFSGQKPPFVVVDISPSDTLKAKVFFPPK